VGLLARSRAELNLAKLEIEHAGGTAMRICADVRDYDQLARAVGRMTVAFGGVHILIAAAAVQGPVGPLLEIDRKRWIETIEVNLVGVMNACRAALPQMIQRRSGKILVIAGGGAAYSRPNFSAYAASKAAVVRLVETLADEVREYNVQVNALAPGGTYTHMIDEIIQAGEKAGAKALDEAVQLRQTGGTSPDKQIRLALFLAAENANHISGKLIHVNDDWRRLEGANMHPDSLTLRRITKALRAGRG